MGLTIYQLARGCSCKTLAALLGFSVPSGNEFFNKFCEIIDGTLHDQYAHLPNNEAECRAEVIVF